MDGTRPRLLLLKGETVGRQEAVRSLEQFFDIDTVDRLQSALDALREHDYDSVFADVGDFLPLEQALVGRQASLVLDTIGEGACVIDGKGKCRWSNNQMRNFTPDVFDKVVGICGQARSIFAEQVKHDDVRRRNRSKKFSFRGENDRYFELVASPVIGTDQEIGQVVAVVWEATTNRRLQQKIDAIDAAGRELARLDIDEVAKAGPDQRLQILQDKIIRYSRDLMHFDHFAIRVLDKRSNKLEVVIADGMPADALDMDLYSHPEGSGISGYVASTGRSYICHDTEKDSRYVPGIEHAKSSLTVPLRVHDSVIGVFNIESQEVGTFDEEDRQFAEIFGRYVAIALNMLQLLVVERTTISGQMADSVVQDVAEPLNDIITAAQSLMEEYIGDDLMRKRLAAIIENVQAVRGTVREVAAGPRAVRGSGRVEVAEEDAILAGRTVLIADDEANIRTTIADILEKHGCICTVCKDGHEATNQLQQQRFDLVLSDIKMPYRNGYEIFATARRDSETIPVILMTGFGYDANHSIVRASQEGLSGVLFKPFKVEQLLERVRLGLQASKHVDETTEAPER